MSELDIFCFLEGNFDQQLALDPVQDALDSLQLPCLLWFVEILQCFSSTLFMGKNKQQKNKHTKRLCYLKLERCNVGRQEKVHIRIFPLSSSVNNWFGRHDSTQEHEAKLCTGVVGLKSVTGGLNLEVG